VKQKKQFEVSKNFRRKLLYVLQLKETTIEFLGEKKKSFGTNLNKFGCLLGFKTFYPREKKKS